MTEPVPPPLPDFPLPLATRPMEARSAKILPEGEGWQFEPKWDGFRCLAFRGADAVALQGKSGKPLDRFFPEVLAILRRVPGRFVIDGELVVEAEGGPSFEALQMRLHPAESRIRRLSAETPAHLVVFDMLAGPDGTVLLDRPLAERRSRAERLVAAAGLPAAVRLSPATQDREAARRWLEEAGSGPTDGVVAKRVADAYAPGERTMVKVKRLRTADCVVGGYRTESDSDEVGSLLLGLYDEAGLLHHVGFTVLTDEIRTGLTRELDGMRAEASFTGKAPGGPSRWSTERSDAWQPVRPEIVVEVRFDQVTGARFRHGTKLMRRRPDKAPRQCSFEQIAPPLGRQ